MRRADLKCLENIKRQSVVSRSDAGVDEGGVGVDVGVDAPPPHVCHQGQGLSQLLPLPTQADHCKAHHLVSSVHKVFVVTD